MSEKSTGQNLPSLIVACVQSTVHQKNLLLYLEIRVSCISFYSIFIVFQSYILSYYFLIFLILLPLRVIITFSLTIFSFPIFHAALLRVISSRERQGYFKSFILSV